MQPVPVGVVGQLYLGGDGLARGYLRRPELTAEKFIPTHSSPTRTRAFTTRAIWPVICQTDALECLGRTDHQIKIRGYRIELGEIETVLQKNEGVSQAVVALREVGQGNQQLIGYYVPAPACRACRPRNCACGSNAMCLNTWCRSSLISIDAVPLTPNGKVDRKALPAPQSHRYGQVGQRD